MPTSNYQPVRLLVIKYVNLYQQTVQTQISWLLQKLWSGSTLFAKAGHIHAQQDQG